MDDRRLSVRVSTGARLHFGLMNTRPPFGGIGVMIDQPLTSVEVSAAQHFDAGSIQPQRLTAIAQRLCAAFSVPSDARGLPPCAIRVRASAPAHSGLGSGTQLALAAATALANHFELQLTRQQLVEMLADRGRRSVIGSLGFFAGGLIAENGMIEDYLPSSHWRRLDPPADWHIVLARPPQGDRPVCGEAEGQAFAALAAAPESLRNELIQLGDQVTAAVEQADFETFAAALTQFNRASGTLFAAQQGGCYNGPVITDLVRQIHAAGARGYGQSSWGPTVFAFCPTQHAAEQLAERLTGQLVTLTKPQPCGALVERF